MPAGVMPLILCGVALVGGIGAEIYGGGDGRNVPSRLPALSVPIRRENGQMGQGEQAGWVGTILARPLFNPSRRLVASVTACPQSLRLAGIIISPTGRKAIFAVSGVPEKVGTDKSSLRGMPVGEGEQAGPWHVRHIGAQTVEVDGAGGVQTLRPERASGASSHRPTRPAAKEDDVPPSSADDEILIPASRFPAPPPRPDQPHP